VDIRKNQKRIIAAGIGLAVLAAIAAWQFYLFVVFSNTDGVVDLQGGTVHLWMAIGIGLITCVGAFFLISSFRRYEVGNEMHITSQGRP
jgi:Kef-type K+ transport system membrane component KefB